jgi:capsular polysaccharide biosynthesis protein
MRRIYVPPQGQSGVALGNAQAVAELADAMGYETIDPAAMTMRELADCFASASHVVGATSEALTGLLFAAEGTSVLELRVVHWVRSGGRMHFDTLARSAGLSYSAVECLRAGVDESNTTVVDVDLDTLRAALEQMP